MSTVTISDKNKEYTVIRYFTAKTWDEMDDVQIQANAVVTFAFQDKNTKKYYRINDTGDIVIINDVDIEKITKGGKKSSRKASHKTQSRRRRRTNRRRRHY
jgi:hypothetical protein